MSKFVKVENILGKKEVQDLLGCTDSQIDNLAYREPDFPKPFLKLKASRLWEKPVILLWMEKKSRQEALIPVEPPNPEPTRPQLPSAKPVPMSDDERQALLKKIFG